MLPWSLNMLTIFEGGPPYPSSLKTRVNTFLRNSASWTPVSLWIRDPSGLKKSRVTLPLSFISAKIRPSWVVRLATRKVTLSLNSGSSELTTRLSSRQDPQPGSWTWTTTFVPCPIRVRSWFSLELSQKSQTAMMITRTLVMELSQRTWSLLRVFKLFFLWSFLLIRSLFFKHSLKHEAIDDSNPPIWAFLLKSFLRLNQNGVGSRETSC